MSPWWLTLVAALVGGAALLIVAVVRDGDVPEGVDPGSTLPPTIVVTTSISPGVAITVPPPGVSLEAATTALSPARPLPTQPPAVATTPAAVAPTSSGVDAPGSIEELSAALQANPGAFGPRALDVIDQLDKINGRGRSAQRRAADLLDQAAAWVESGELAPVALAMLEPVLRPIATSGPGDDDSAE